MVTFSLLAILFVVAMFGAHFLGWHAGADYSREQTFNILISHAAKAFNVTEAEAKKRMGAINREELRAQMQRESNA